MLKKNSKRTECNLCKARFNHERDGKCLPVKNHVDKMHNYSTWLVFWGSYLANLPPNPVTHRIMDFTMYDVCASVHVFQLTQAS